MEKYYSELLKHPKWQKKRLEIMQRDNFKCCFCNDDETTLNVHHKEYEYNKKPWEYEDNNFITLCEDCHKLVKDLKIINTKGGLLEYKNSSILKFPKLDENQTCVFLGIYLDKQLSLVVINEDGSITKRMMMGPISTNLLKEFLNNQND